MSKNNFPEAIKTFLSGDKYNIAIANHMLFKKRKQTLHEVNHLKHSVLNPVAYLCSRVHWSLVQNAHTKFILRLSQLFSCQLLSFGTHSVVFSHYILESFLQASRSGFNGTFTSFRFWTLVGNMLEGTSPHIRRPVVGRLFSIVAVNLLNYTTRNKTCIFRYHYVYKIQ